jgi:hypothetical protein
MKTTWPDAEGAKITQKTQKKSLLNFFGELCVIFAPSASCLASSCTHVAH